MHYTKFNFGDYARDTSHLSLMEHGAYLQLMRLYYLTEKPLTTTAELYRLVGARAVEEREAVDAVIRDFFVEVDGGLHHSRIDREIAKCTAKATHNREVGKLGGRPVGSGKKPKGNPEETQMVNFDNPHITPPQDLKTSRQKQKPSGGEPPAGFTKFWEAYPRCSRKEAKGKCADLWLAKRFEDLAPEILAHIEAKKSNGWDDPKYIPAPLVYLNGRRWEGADVESIDQFAGVLHG